MAMTFTERLHRRGREWWSPARQLWKPRSVIDLVDRNLQRRRLMSRHDNIKSWHRGRYWQRRLNNKWNSREFAVMNGYRVPELYWHGRNPARIPFSELPPNYVIREAWSYGGKSVYLVADGQELLRDSPVCSREIVGQLRSVRDPVWPFPILVEEFLRTNLGEYRQHVDYKFHCFDGQVAAISVQAGRQAGHSSPQCNYYDEFWNAIPESMRSHEFELTHFDKPASFDEMLDCASVLSRAYESYVRIDLYDTDRGCVFGEVASYPSGGRHFSSSADRLLGEYWSRYCDDRI
jgi:hypothetical protein